MGNFSRDPKTRLEDSKAKHYVGVRLQQGVPVLDADWNELEDLRKSEIETLGSWFIGDGVPSGSDGFRILPGAEDNDFIIGKGLVLVDGKSVINDKPTTYLEQVNFDANDALSTPQADNSYIVYLETWEREVDSEEDPVLVDDRIGVETCVRLRREWVVKVIEGDAPDDLPEPAQGHSCSHLALLRRSANNAKITFEMITDLRRLHLTLEDTTKAPLEIYGPMGELTYTLDNFADMLNITEEAYFKLLESDLFMTNNFAMATPLETVTISAVFGDIMQTAKTLSLQAQINNLSNQDGLKALTALYKSQKNFTSEIGKLVAGQADKIKTSDLIERLGELLDGGSSGIPPGLRNAVHTEKNLEASIKAQEDINREIGNRVQILPHGHLSVLFVSGPPEGTVISKGQTYRYEFQISFEKITPTAYQETFDIILAMDPPGWTPKLVGLPENNISLNTGDTIAVQVDVKIPAGSSVETANLLLRVRSKHNPSEMDTTNTDVSLTVGAGGSQPSPLDIQLLSPAMNVETDILSVGRGGPMGLAGKSKNLKFKFSLNEEVSSPVDYNVSFVSTPGGVFDPIADVSLQLGAGAGQEVTKDFVLQATDASINGTTGTLTVRIEDETDSNIFKKMEIKFQIQKS